MRKVGIASLLIALIMTPMGTAGYPTQFFLLDGGSVRVEKGAVMVDRKGGSDRAWNRENERRASPERWYLSGTLIHSSVKGGYLAYDPSGKDRRVTLLQKPSAQTEWEIVVKKTPSGYDTATVKALKGTVRGWQLEIEEGKLVLSKEPRRPVKVGRLVLGK